MNSMLATVGVTVLLEQKVDGCLRRNYLFLKSLLDFTQTKPRLGEQTARVLASILKRGMSAPDTRRQEDKTAADN